MPTFHGFVTSDFSDQVDGVYWRGPHALGGLLAGALNDSFGGDFSSWAVPRRTQVHIARKSQYSFNDPFPHAKLFVYTPPDQVAFGFYVEKADHPIDRKWDWARFLANLENDPVARAALLGAMRNHGLTLTDYYNQDGGGALGRKMLYWQGRFCWPRPQDDPRPVTLDDLVRLLAGLHDNTWRDLHVFTAIQKAEAIALGDRVVHSILTVFHSLVPVCEAAITDRHT